MPRRTARPALKSVALLGPGIEGGSAQSDEAGGTVAEGV